MDIKLDHVSHHPLVDLPLTVKNCGKREQHASKSTHLTHLLSSSLQNFSRTFTERVGEPFLEGSNKSRLYQSLNVGAMICPNERVRALKPHRDIELRWHDAPPSC